MYGQNTKEKNKIQESRVILKEYNKKNLAMQNFQGFTYFGIGTNILKSSSNSSINNRNIIYNKDLSDQQLYEAFGKYKTYKDKNGKTVFYSDNNLYKGNEDVEVINFQNNIDGFPNIGNSCYMNSFLQILLHTPKFLEYLSEYENIDNIDSESLIYNLKLLAKFPYNSNYLKNIKSIMGDVNPKYGTFSPGDSQNFAIDFLDQLICECKNEKSNDDSTKSKNIIQSKIKSYKSFCEDYHNKKDKIEKLFQFTEIGKRTSSTGKYTFSINLHIELSFPPNCKNPIDIYTLLDCKYSKKIDIWLIINIFINRG